LIVDQVIEMVIRDLLLRFILGGSAVVLSYVTAQRLPWKAIGGIFATFPAVMVVAVMMVGWKKGSKEAAKTARGSVYGMIGGLICVMTLLFTLKTTQNWGISVILGLLMWLTSSLVLAHR